MNLTTFFNTLENVSDRGSQLLYFKENEQGQVVEIATAGKWKLGDRMDLSKKGFKRYRGEPGSVALKVNAIIANMLAGAQENDPVPVNYQQTLEKFQARLSNKGKVNPKVLQVSIEAIAQRANLAHAQPAPADDASELGSFLDSLRRSDGPVSGTLPQAVPGRAGTPASTTDRASSGSSDSPRYAESGSPTMPVPLPFNPRDYLQSRLGDQRDPRVRSELVRALAQGSLTTAMQIDKAIEIADHFEEHSREFPCVDLSPALQSRLIREIPKAQTELDLDSKAFELLKEQRREELHYIIGRDHDLRKHGFPVDLLRIDDLFNLPYHQFSQAVLERAQSLLVLRMDNIRKAKDDLRRLEWLLGKQEETQVLSSAFIFEDYISGKMRIDAPVLVPSPEMALENDPVLPKERYFRTYDGTALVPGLVERALKRFKPDLRIDRGAILVAVKGKTVEEAARIVQAEINRTLFESLQFTYHSQLHDRFLDSKEGKQWSLLTCYLGTVEGDWDLPSENDQVFADQTAVYKMSRAKLAALFPQEKDRLRAEALERLRKEIEPLAKLVPQRAMAGEQLKGLVLAEIRRKLPQATWEQVERGEFNLLDYLQPQALGPEFPNKVVLARYRQVEPALRAM